MNDKDEKVCKGGWGASLRAKEEERGEREKETRTSNGKMVQKPILSEEGDSGEGERNDEEYR